VRLLARVPIRVRLTLASALAMAVVLAGTGVFLYARVERALDRTIDDGLRARAEAVAALVAWARRQPGVTRVLAETACTNTAALAVYEAAGMRRAGADGDLVFFEG